jgi:uncharacterized protein YceH (UPF0502 family)
LAKFRLKFFSPLRKQGLFLYAYDSIEEVQTTLQNLSKRGFVKAIERRPGKKKAYYVHLLGDSF